MGWGGVSDLAGCQNAAVTRRSIYGSRKAEPQAPILGLLAGYAGVSAKSQSGRIFLAFLPQFIVEGAGPAQAQLLLHGSLIIVVAAVIEPPLVLAGAKLGSFLKRKPRVGLWMDRSLGALFIALGARLAASAK